MSYARPLDEQFPAMIWTARPFSNSPTNVDATVCVRVNGPYIYIGEPWTVTYVDVPYVCPCSGIDIFDVVNFNESPRYILDEQLLHWFFDQNWDEARSISCFFRLR